MWLTARASDRRKLDDPDDPRRRELACWLTGVPWVTSAAAAARERVEQRPPGVTSASALLAIGLELRVGCVLSGRDLRTYRRLRDEGAELPRGLAVCKRCLVVFRPRRKGAARRCEDCYAGRARADAPAQVHVRCVQCGHSFWARRRDHRYCTERCRVRAHRARS